MEKEAIASETRSEEKQKINELEETLKEQADELQVMESFQSCLISKEEEANDELESIKSVLIEELMDVTRSESTIGVRLMGQLDEEVFLSACKLKGAKGGLELEAALLCSKWQNEINRPDWHPFSVTTIDGEAKEDIMDDKKLVALKEELGIEVYSAVVRALLEMNNYNPSSRRPMPVLWNFSEDREASVSEVIEHVLKDLKTVI